MHYIFVDYEAILHLTGSKQFQSSSFERSRRLLAVLKGESAEMDDPVLSVLSDITNQGIVLVAPGSRLLKGIFFDLSTYTGFNQIDSNLISHFQIILKFALRLWAGNTFSFREKILDNNKALIFPNSFKNNESQYKILIDRLPYEKRLATREYEIIQVYANGYGQISVKPNYQNLRLFLEIQQQLYSNFLANISKKTNTQQQANRPVAVATLGKHNYSISSLPFSDWLTHLTKEQMDFVFRDTGVPERLEGAAGTGKTLTLILRAINIFNQALEADKNCRIIFLTHSGATKKQIFERFITIAPELEAYTTDNNTYQQIEITTLSDWCIKHLGTQVDETQLLERDAQDSKTHQYLLIEEVFQNVMNSEFETYKPIISSSFRNFLENSDRELLIEMLQFEIGVTIKGKAEEDFDKYLKTLSQRSPFGIPAQNKSDLDFLFVIYSNYKNKLSHTDQYDVDDIVLTSLGILRTPIWRRRKNMDGYDLVIIDETHLFNFNELSVFHNLLKDSAINNIVFAIDKTQAVGDRGLTDEVLNEQLNLSESSTNMKFNTVFRSSSQIIDLAYSILSSGASLFQSNFENPINANTEFAFTASDESNTKKPIAYGMQSHNNLVECPFQIADKLSDNLHCSKDNILIIGCSDSLVEELEKKARILNKPVELLTQRGDTETIRVANKTNRYILGAIDFVGGLEFSAVILVGVDQGRVPPTDQNNSYSFHFINYAWHNRLYVAVTRAKFRVVMLYEKARGLSSILNAAQQGEIIDLEDYH